MINFTDDSEDFATERKLLIDLIISAHELVCAKYFQLHLERVKDIVCLKKFQRTENMYFPYFHFYFHHCGLVLHDH